MKKVLIVHYGSWFDEKAVKHYQMEIDILTKLLKEGNILVERLERLPTNDEIATCDAIIVISISFKKEAKRIKARTDKTIFMITGLPEKGDDDFGVIPLHKSLGYHVNVQVIIEKLTQ